MDQPSSHWMNFYEYDIGGFFENVKKIQV